jgi:polyisoprenoid-binding protein YceI
MGCIVNRSTTGVIAIGLTAAALLIVFRFIGGAEVRSSQTGAPTLPADPPPSAATPTTPAAGAGVVRFVITPQDSRVTYRVNETFFREGNRLNTAVGITQGIRGEIVIDRADPRRSTIGPITVDISQFRSDSDRRDNAIRDRWLESRRFPTAQFTTTAIRGLPSAYRDGEDLRLQITGNLKIRDRERPVTFNAAVKVAGTTLTGTATTAIKMTDFGFDPPSILGILRAENDVALEFAIVARAQ